MRLSSQLLRLLEKVGTRSVGHIEIKLSRQELAQMNRHDYLYGKPSA